MGGVAHLPSCRRHEVAGVAVYRQQLAQQQDACATGGRAYLALGLFFEPTRETKRSASYTLLPAVFRAAAASVGLLCGVGWGVVL